ncbi:allophycocyanin subunit alpha-B [Phormidesmis sp. 146-35]
MSIITRSIVNADREARYLNPGELQAIRGFFEEGESRLRIAMVLSANERKIVDKGTQRFWERCPVTPSNSGNPRFRESCMRDQLWYVRLVTYSVIVGDTELIREVGTKGAQEMYNSLGVPIKNVAECMRCLKEVALDFLPLDDAAEVTPYFDDLIQAFIP